MVNDDINKYLALKPVYFVGQLLKLLETCCGSIKFNECRINRQEILTGVGTAEASEASVSGWGGVDGEEMEDFAV